MTKEETKEILEIFKQYIPITSATDSERLIICDALDTAIQSLEQDPKTGHWIVREDNTSYVRQLPRRWVECSHCGWSFSYDRIKDNYCSKCGARMSEVSE